MSNDNRIRERGSALATAVHVLLLLLVLGQVVYLASRNRVRVDLTSDRLWSATNTTKAILAKLDKRLVIEAYFSPKEKLPVVVREMRSWADSFLDELVQLGQGKVVVQRFDPNADKAIEDKAKRVGIEPAELSSRSTTSLSVDRHWQGLRLVYGGGKQKVVKQFGPRSSFEAEWVLATAIKEVATESKRKVGYMEWPARDAGGQQQQGIGWNTVRTSEVVSKRYEFQNFKDEDGALLPADVGTLFLFRPKDLTDRQKYVFDQFVQGGGTLVAFVDAAEYMVGPQRTFNKLPLQVDAAGSTLKFVDQLQHYGLDWKPKVLADLARDAWVPHDPMRAPYEYFSVQQQTGLGPQMRILEYPYFFHPVAREWSQVASEFAKDKSGKLDAALAEEYRKSFVAGMPSDDFLFQYWKKLGKGPGFYWPTWTGLRTKAGGVVDLPADVQGRVLFWTSPAMLADDPPQQSLNPLGYGDMNQKSANLEKFRLTLYERLAAEPRQQAPLMAEVRGRFTSCFAGHDRPKRPSEIKEEEAKKKEEEAKKGEVSPADDKGEVVHKPEDGPSPAKKQDKPDAPVVVAEAPMVARAEKPGRIVLIGDSDFVRDDFLATNYAQAGGPYSLFGLQFFASMLDWLAEDRDLAELQSKAPEDRTLKFVDTVTTATADPRLQEQALRSKLSWLRIANVVVPGALFGAFGLVVFFVRRAQKRAFLASLN